MGLGHRVTTGSAPSMKISAKLCTLFRLDARDWSQLGTDICAEAEGDQSVFTFSFL